MAPLLLVDYSSLLYRAFHSLPSSVPAQGVHGFLNMLARLVTDRRGALAIAVDDDWRPEFRVATLPSYKAHRVAGPDDEPDPVTPQEELGRKVLLAMLVDMKTPGITVRPLRQMTDDAEFCEVFFEDVRVPAENLLGAPGAGWGIAMGIVQHERGPMWTFVFQRKIRRSLAQLVQLLREHPGAANALRDPVVRQRLAQAHIEVELLRLSGYRSLTSLLRSGHPGPESSLEKVLGSETDQRLQDLALELFGPYGALREGESALAAGAVARQFLYARSETIMGGTSEIQRNVIAQRILGLPR